MDTEANRPSSPNTPQDADYVWYLSVDESPPGLRLYDDGADSWVTLNSTDADTVDGYHGSDLGALAEDESVTGTWNFQNGVQSEGSGVLTHADEGTLDAGTLDGIDSPAFAQHAQSETISAEWAFQEGLTFDHGQEYPQSPHQPDAYTFPSFVEHPGADNPVLTAGDFNLSTGEPVETVADPFITRDGAQFQMFIEAKENTTPAQNLHYATSPDGVTWTEQGEILNTSGNLSYPQVFKIDGTWYLLPDDTGLDAERTVYEGDPFPSSWASVTTLSLGSVSMSDTTAFRYNDRWWLYWQDEDGSGNPTVELAYNDTFPATTSDWTMHPSSPIRAAGTAERPGGRPRVHDDYIDIPLQAEVDGDYGMETRVYRITDLTTDTYSDAELGASPILQGVGDMPRWNGHRMHHFDAMEGSHGNISFAAVDGAQGSGEWSVGIEMPVATEPVKASLGMDTGQTISSGATTDVVLDRTFADTHRAHDTSSGRWTCPKDGFYAVTGQFGVAYNATSDDRVTLDFNNHTTSSRIIRTNTVPSGDATYQSLALRPRIIYLTGGDEYKLVVTNTSGSDLDLNTGEDQTGINIRRVPMR